MLFNHKVVSFLFALFILFISTLANASESNISAAACVIRAGDKVVLVKEILTNKLSIPAGGIDAGESPMLAAQRETWEETGLVVSIKRELARDEKTVFYDCVSDSDIVSFQFNNRINGYELPIWFAPHYGVEVSAAMLIAPSDVPRDEYRFPEQLDWLAEILPETTDQEVVFVGNLSQAAPWFHQIELSWMAQVQHLLLKLPNWVTSLIEPVILAGNWLAEPVLIILLFPLLYWRFGKEFGYKIFFAFTMTSLLSLVAQQGFAFPRPHVYLPELELEQSYGYSLPSIPIAVWSCVGLLILHAREKLTINACSLTLVGLISWLGVAKFYSGAAFLLDSLSGAILGLLCAWHLIRLESKPDVDAEGLMTSKAVWLVLLFACLVMTLFWPIPTFSYWLAVIITVLGLVVTFKRGSNIASGRALIAIVALLLIVNVAISLVATLVSTSSIASLSVEAVRYPILLCLFVLSIRKVSKAT